MKNFDLAKKICKEHGIKGFRKTRQKHASYIAGKQCAQINKHVALRLIGKLLEAGFVIEQLKTSKELASKGHLDTISIF